MLSTTRRRAKGLIIVGSTLAGLLTATAAHAASSPTPFTTSNVVPSHGMLIGAAAAPSGGQTLTQAFDQLETNTHSTFDLHRDYAKWDDPVPQSTVKDDWAAGRIPVLSIIAKSRGGGRISWASIAAGAQDAVIGHAADSLKAYGKPIILSFHHEPENDIPANGTQADYVAAWRHYVSVFRAHHADNVQFAWIVMSTSFGKWRPWADSLYPGDDYVDWIAADGYNFNGCTGTVNQPWRSFNDIFGDLKTWAASHPSKPIMLAEVGSQEDPSQPGRKAQWFNDMDTQLRSWSQVKAISYWNDSEKCSWFVTSSASSLSAFSNMVNDPALQPSWDGVAPTAPTVTTGAVSGVDAQDATLAGQITSGGAATTWHVDYGTTTSYGTSTSDAALSADGPVSATLSALAPGTTYHARFAATNSAGTTYSSDIVFTTPSLPVIGAIQASQTGAGTASITVPVTAAGAANWRVDFGPTTSYGSSVTGTVTDAAATPVTAQLTGLAAGSTVHFRVTLANAAGSVSSADGSVVLAALPVPQAMKVLQVQSKSAKVQAPVKVGGAAATYRFQWTRTTVYGHKSTTVTVPAGQSAVTAAATLSGLLPHTAYRVRLMVTTLSGTVYSREIIVHTR